MVAAKKQKYSIGLCIYLNMILSYKSINFDEQLLFPLLLSLSYVMFSGSITTFLIRHHQNNALCNNFLGAAGADAGGDKGISRFKYLIVNDKHHFTTI